MSDPVTKFILEVRAALPAIGYYETCDVRESLNCIADALKAMDESLAATNSIPATMHVKWDNDSETAKIPANEITNTR